MQVKRILDCTSADFVAYGPRELKQSIFAAEGRTVCAEMVITRPSPAGPASHAEVARAFGADLMLLNTLDCLEPDVFGVPKGEEAIRSLKKLVGRPIGANLEPVDPDAEMLEHRLLLPKGRMASAETFEAAKKIGLDFICLTGNPGTGVTNAAIVESIRLAKKHFGGLIIAGKMHGAGAKEPVASVETARLFLEAGADILLVPAVGTVPGFTDAELVEVVKMAHEQGCLVMSTIGTSQESATARIIEDLAIRNKVCGVDIQHIGDAGYHGLAPAENIFAMSVALRGMRHTLARVAISVNRE